MSYDQEYYCPHCGAILNEQPGFDPDNGTWTCTECGQMLMDEDVYEGDTYEGVAWFCDNCGALLNRQSGFSDSYGSWTCTECGHVNGTTEDDIINSDSGQFSCPKCGASLDSQFCFNKYDDDWECTECGAHLHHEYSDDEYEEVEEPKHKCPNCGAALDNQWGFTEYDDDWECTECGAHLHHDYSDDEYEEVEDDVDDEDDDEDGGYTTNSYSSPRANSGQSSETHSHETFKKAQQQARARSKPQKAPKKKSGLFGKLFVFLLLLGALGYGSRSLFSGVDSTNSHIGEIKLKYSASSYKSENYYNAIIKLDNQGLSDIRLTPLNDLKTGILSKEGEIASIEINGVSDFQSGSWVSADSVVSITFHSFEKKGKQGYDEGKNTHVILGGIDIQLPSYLIEDSQDASSAVYHVKGDEESNMIILFDNLQDWKGLTQYDTHFVLQREKGPFSDGSGETVIALGKKNDKVYSIRIVTLKIDAYKTYLHLVMTSPDTCRTEYVEDFDAIVSGIYIPSESEIRIDFSQKYFKGKNVEEAVAELKNKGFENIQVQNLQDIVLGLFVKEGEVESIAINGSTDFELGDWISNQAEIVITYHGK